MRVLRLRLLVDLVEVELLTVGPVPQIYQRIEQRELRHRVIEEQATTCRLVRHDRVRAQVR